jgi:hypothetical protein
MNSVCPVIKPMMELTDVTQEVKPIVNDVNTDSAVSADAPTDAPADAPTDAPADTPAVIAIDTALHSIFQHLPFSVHYPSANTSRLHIPPGVQKEAILQSLWQNMPFYFVLVACMYWLSPKHGFLVSLLTVTLVSLYSFGMHYISHHLLCMDWYNQYDTMITRSPTVGGFLRMLFKFTDSHAVIHHDSSVNKLWYNVLLEFVNNFVSQGGMLIALKYLLQKANSKAILFWALFYPAVHNINYRFVYSKVHYQHHCDPTTNYFMDIWDILIGTKYDWSTVESHNHAAITAIVITAGILGGSHYLGW